MKKKEKRGLLILIIIAIAIITILAIITNRKGKEVNNDATEENKVVEEFVQVLEDGTKLNTSTKLSETKIVNGLTNNAKWTISIISRCRK